MKKIIIVGGGASGVVCGIFAKREDNEVIILERNSKPLKKLLMTGNGRCNYMNEVYGKSFYHSEDMDIVDRILSSKNIQSMKDFFDTLGIIPKIKNGYYYPFSNQATTIYHALLEEAKYRGVSIICDTYVEKIEKQEDNFFLKTSHGDYTCDMLVLAVGSRAYPKTGSDGDGYSFLRKFSHTIVDPVPALVPLIGKGSYFKEWAGVRSDASLELFEDGKFIKRVEGEIQLTDYGISGICTFQLSHIVSRGLHEGKSEMIKINFVPFIETLITPWMSQYSKKQTHKNVRELLEGFLNYKIVSVLLKYCKISPDTYYSDLSNEKKLILCKSLRSFPVEIVDTKGFEFAQICNGGVKLKEIDSHTMESKLVSRLYIIGELLDMNGDCGGYNLTTCWISGILAGKAIGDYHD